MFVADRPEIAEANINLCLKESDAKVIHIGQSQSERNGRFIFVISIFYLLD